MARREIRVFLSSTFDNSMQMLRNSFRNEISARLNDVVGRLGSNIYFYDYEIGIPDGTEGAEVLRICFDAIRKCDYFVFILGDYYGSNVTDLLGRNNYISDDADAMNIVQEGINETLSVLECELRFALKLNKICMFCIDKDVDFFSQNEQLRKLYQFALSNSEKEFNSLIYFAGHKSETKELRDGIVHYFEDVFSPHRNGLTLEQQNKNLFSASKTRYSIPPENELTDLYDYIDGDMRSCYCLYGSSGSGKSTLLVNLEYDLRNKSNYVVGSCYVGVNNIHITDVLKELYDNMLEYIPEVKNDPFYIGGHDMEAVDRFLFIVNNALTSCSKRVVLIIDGINNITFPEEGIGNYWWLTIALPENVKLIFSTIELLEGDFIKHKITSICPQKTIAYILSKEGKGSVLEIFANADYPKDLIPIQCVLAYQIVKLRLNYRNSKQDISKYFSSSPKELYTQLINTVIDYYSYSTAEHFFICLYFSKYGFTPFQIAYITGDYDVIDLIYSINDLLNRSATHRISITDVLLKTAIDEVFDASGKNEDYRKQIISFIESDCELDIFPRFIVSMIAEGNTKNEDMTSLLLRHPNFLDDKIATSELAYQLYHLKMYDELKILISNPKTAINLLFVSRQAFTLYLRAYPDLSDVFASWNTIIQLKDEELEWAFYDHCIFLIEVSTILKDYAMSFSSMKILEEIEEKYLGKDCTLLQFVYCDLGHYHYAKNDFKKAIEYTKKALNISEKDKTRLPSAIATHYNMLGMIYDDLDDYNLAVKNYKKAIALLDNNVAHEHPYLSGTIHNLAYTYYKRGKFNKALPMFERALASRLLVYGENHQKIGESYNAIGAVFMSKGDFEKAIDYYEKAMLILDTHYHTDGYHSDRIKNIVNLGFQAHEKSIAFENSEKYDDAIFFMIISLRAFICAYGEIHEMVAGTYHDLADTYSNATNHELAIENNKKALELKAQLYGETSDKNIETLMNLGRDYNAIGDHEEGLKVYERILEIQKANNLPEDDYSYSNTYYSLGLEYYHLNKYNDSLSYNFMALEIRIGKLGRKHADVAIIFQNISAVFYKVGDIKGACNFMFQALSIFKDVRHEYEAQQIWKTLVNISGKDNPEDFHMWLKQQLDIS